MLKISRGKGQSVYVNDTKITLTEIDGNFITLTINDKNPIQLSREQRFLVERTEVLYSSKFRNSILLGFDADRSITILREELYHNKNPLKYVDNSTKQFPSGDFE